MDSRTQWTWIWLNSGSWWWTGRPGVLQSMGSQKVGQGWVTELNLPRGNQTLHVSRLICLLSTFPASSVSSWKTSFHLWQFPFYFPSLSFLSCLFPIVSAYKSALLSSSFLFLLTSLLFLLIFPLTPKISSRIGWENCHRRECLEVRKKLCLIIHIHL